MNKEEARQHAHDMQIVEKAVHDAEKGKFDPPGGNGIMAFIEGAASAATFEAFSDKNKGQDRDTYKAAYDEAKKKH
jgi:hypothetical protein